MAEEESPNKNNARVVGGWTRDVHVVDMQTMTELEARVRKEVENQLVHKIKEAEKSLQHERELRYKAEDEASVASSAKKSFDDLNIAMTEMNELSNQAALQVMSAKEKARHAKEEANMYKQKAIKSEAIKDEALRKCEELEQSKNRALKSAAAAKEAEERAVKQAAVHAEAMAERHALHAQRVRETSERDIVEREKALAKGMHLASKRVHNITSSLSASFSEAVARLEAEHADAIGDLESDREALLLRKAIGQSAYAVMLAEKEQAKQLVEHRNENVNSSNVNISSPIRTTLGEKAEESMIDISPKESPTAKPSSPVYVSPSQPKHMSKIVAMLAKSEEHAKQELEGQHCDSPNRGLSEDTVEFTKVNMNAHLPPIVIDSIKESFNAANAHIHTKP